MNRKDFQLMQSSQQKRKTVNPLSAFLLIFQGALVGVGAVLPGISGGVLSVIFGIYKPLMEFLSNPGKTFKIHFPRLFPFFCGYILGFLGIANVLSFFLKKYPDPSVCVFIGLITGMLPSLFREAGEQGRSKGSYISMILCMCVIFALLIGLHMTSIEVSPNFFWYLFCGFCLALSLIAPGMSFSTLLMPLGLYTPFVDGIGHFNLNILVPGAVGAVITVICLAKTVNVLFHKYYSFAFHGIIGIVIAATVTIVPVRSFSAPGSAVLNAFCILAGIGAALALDKFNSQVKAKQ